MIEKQKNFKSYKNLTFYNYLLSTPSVPGIALIAETTKNLAPFMDFMMLC